MDNAVGLITEYNPFHNGHLHHLRESLELSGADVSVAVMSGHFLQRGEPALTDKWVRAQMALASGVDVVVELPFPWACNSAPHFARGAVRALDALGGVRSLCFGSEAGDLEVLKEGAELLDSEKWADETAAAQRLGFSYPAARSRVLAARPGDSRGASALCTPNNILGVAYLRALRREGSAMRALTVRRVGAGYHEEGAVDGIASATGIRRMLREGEDPAPFLPPPVAGILRSTLAQGAVAEEEKLFPLLLSRIFGGVRRLGGIYLVEDGIERRLQEGADTAAGYRDLVSAVKSRHLTRTRVQRLLMMLLNEVTAEEMTAFLESGPLYLHLLGASPRGCAFLGASRKRLRIPLIGNYSRVYPLLKRRYGAGTPSHDLALAQLALELRATRNYTLLLRRGSAANRNRDFFEKQRSPT